MKDTKALAQLLAQRTRAWEVIGSTEKQMCMLDPPTRFRIEMASQEFRETDAKIVRILNGLPGPASVGDVVLHLTRDRANFVELDPATGKAIWSPEPIPPGDLYRYPRKEPVPA